ncbi:MAG TPA: hypothetical protein VK558_09430 [Patescibacteria group bacterium]|nr:hypothetical protein [Patescibacteria group bacterium]
MPEAPLPLSATRRLDLAAADPLAAWADVVNRPEDIAAARALAAAVMGDVRRKRSWALAWGIATTLAYHAFYRPFGQYVDESDAFAALSGGVVSRADMAALQRLYTLAHAGCSTVLAWDRAQKRMVHFRSLDWPSAGAIANATRIVHACRGDGPPVFSAAGILGQSGVLTAVKPGFSIAINFAPWCGPSLSLRMDPTFLIRQLMTSAVASYAEARAVIATWRPSAPVFISLCGIAKGEACLFEFGAGTGDVPVADIGERDFLVRTNHFDHDSPFVGHNRAQASGRDWDAYPVLLTSGVRRSMLEDTLAAAYGSVEPFDLEDSLRQAFLRPPVWNHQTAQWVMMLPQSGDVRVWVR